MATEERRRRNRESSARCYYNRKQRVAAAERALAAQKVRAIALYDRELQLRSENARLKTAVVAAGLRIPPALLASRAARPPPRPPPVSGP